MRIRYLTFIGLLALGLINCSDSDFAGANKKGGKDTSESSGDDDDDDDDNDDGKLSGGIEFDDEGEGGLGAGGEEALDDFINSDDKIRTFDGGSVLERFNVAETDSPVDVAIVIDTSGSMDKEIKHVETNLVKFMDTLANDPKTEKIQLFVLAGETNNKLNPPAAVAANANFTFDNSKNKGVNSHNALGVARDFLSLTYVLPKLALRPEAAKQFVFISDDEAKNKSGGITGAEFKTYLQTNHAEQSVNIHSIVCPTKAANCYNAGLGYIGLSNDAEYKGIVQDLQTEDWGPLFDNLIDSIKAKLDFRFGLSQKLGADEKLFVYVKGKKLEDSQYSVEDNFVEIDTDALEAEAEVVILYFKDE
jgi:hypothetical protein